MNPNTPEDRGLHHGSWQELARQLMTVSSGTDVTPQVVAGRARALRDRVPQIADEIADEVLRGAPATSGFLSSRTVLVEATTAAVHRFLDSIDGAPHRERGAEKLFRALGRTEAKAGRSLADLKAGLRIAASVAWRHIREVDLDAGDDLDTRGELADVLFAFLDHLDAEATLGHRTHREQRETDPALLRARLAEQLLTGVSPSEDVSDAWEIPASIVVGVVELAEAERPDLHQLARHTLIVRNGERLILLSDAANRDVIEKAVTAAAQGRLAISWEVQASGVPAAHAWARRALELAARGVIHDGPVIHCAEHLTQIWLHAEPTLRQRLCQEMLAPLLAETPNSREILSETLLVWLETRDSAPAIAAHLGVHPQTVRYRWKRINELFGEDLHDSDFILQITMLLKASVPLWKAGDQSDFERFRGEVEA